MLWKIFFGVWLYCWKYHRKHIFYLLLTFSHIFSAAKQIYNFIPQFRNTNKTQKKKIKIRSNWEKKEEREDDRFWGRGRSVLGCDDRDQGWRIGAAIAIAIGVKARWWLGMTNLGWGRSVLGCDENDRFWGATRMIRRVLGFGFDLSLGVISLAGAWLTGGVCSLPLSSSSISLSLSSLSVFRKMVFEGKIKKKIILHPNTRSTEKHFRKCYFPCATKHPHLQKSISGNDFHPKQTQP